jgi:hypothetical protein
MKYYTIWFLRFKILPRGTQFSTSALTMKVTTDRPQRLISYLVDHMLLAHQDWS